MKSIVFNIETSLVSFKKSLVVQSCNLSLNPSSPRTDIVNESIDNTGLLNIQTNSMSDSIGDIDQSDTVINNISGPIDDINRLNSQTDIINNPIGDPSQLNSQTDNANTFTDDPSPSTIQTDNPRNDTNELIRQPNAMYFAITDPIVPHQPAFPNVSIVEPNLENANIFIASAYCKIINFLLYYFLFLLITFALY